MKRYRVEVPVKAVYIFEVDARTEHQAIQRVCNIIEHVEPDKTKFREIDGSFYLDELNDYDSL